jgi:flagellin-like protein
MHNKKSPRTPHPRGAKHARRRAVSEIVATLIMIAVVASLGVLAFTFASSGLGSLSQSFSSLMGGSGDAISEKFVVEQVTFTTAGTQGADVYVRNVGTISATLVSVYIVDQTSNTFISQTTVSTAVNVGTFVDIPHTTLTFTPSHGHAYSFTVTSSRGNSVIYDAEAT